MAAAAPTTCSYPGCHRLGIAGRCEAHPRKAWSERNPSVKRTLVGRRRHAMRELVLREQPLCPICEAQGRISASTRLDHIVPISEGGSDDRSNLQGLCEPCHDEKTQREALRAKKES